MSSTRIDLAVNGTQNVTATLDQVEAGMDKVARKAAELREQTTLKAGDSLYAGLDRAKTALRELNGMIATVTASVATFTASFKLGGRVYDWIQDNIAGWKAIGAEIDVASAKAEEGQRRVAQAATREAEAVARAANALRRMTASDALAEARTALEVLRGRPGQQDTALYDATSEKNAAQQRLWDIQAQGKAEKARDDAEQHRLDAIAKTQREVAKQTLADARRWRESETMNSNWVTKDAQDKMDRLNRLSDEAQRKADEAARAAAQHRADMAVRALEQQRREVEGETALEKARQQIDAAKKKADEEERKRKKKLYEDQLSALEKELKALRDISGLSDRGAPWLAANSYEAVTFRPMSDANREALATQRDIDAKLAETNRKLDDVRSLWARLEQL